jgi:uncharacterized protein
MTGRPAWGAAWLASLLALVLIAVAAPALAAPTFPDRGTRPVVDDAHVLSAQTQADLTTRLTALEAQTHHQLVVVTLPSLQGYDIEDYGYQLGRAWGIGRASQNDGTLFIVAPTEHKVRIEVGYGLEPIITDALSSQILQSAVLPKFRTNDVEGGVVAGTNALIDQLSLAAPAAQAKAAAAARAPVRHGGGWGGILPMIIIFIVFSLIFRRRGGGGLGWLLPMMFLSSGSRGGGWGGGGGGGWGGGGGGGFSGGGGSFGGGGASGSW